MPANVEDYVKHCGIEFGALAKPLYIQLGIGEDLAFHWQLDADAISRLKIRGLLTDREARKAEQRLVDAVERRFVIGRRSNA